ncbi:hypothetical protein BGZ76_006983, partial [Entomortierella beljakovae]
MTSLRSVRAPVKALAQRHFTSAHAASAQPAVIVGHSNQKLAIVSGVSTMVGVDLTYAYFTFFQKISAFEDAIACNISKTLRSANEINIALSIP